MDRSLQELHCKDGYITVTETVYKNYRPPFNHYENELIIIDDIEDYKNSYPSTPDSMPFGEIDFVHNSLVAVKIGVGAGSGVSSQGCLCYNPDTDKWMFNIEYTISNQCKGSGIYTMDFTGTLICPKLPENANVEFDVRDINPF